MSDNDQKKPLTRLNTDAEAEQFVSEADLSEYDLSGGQTMQFEFEAKAGTRGVPYQRFIR